MLRSSTKRRARGRYLCTLAGTSARRARRDAAAAVGTREGQLRQWPSAAENGIGAITSLHSAILTPISSALKPGLRSFAPQVFSQSLPRKSVSRRRADGTFRDLEHGEHEARPAARPRPRAGCRRGRQTNSPALHAPSPQTRAALEHVGLLDHHMLVVRQPRARAFHEQRHHPGGAIGRAAIWSRRPDTRLFPGQALDVDEA